MALLAEGVKDAAARRRFPWTHPDRWPRCLIRRSRLSSASRASSYPCPGHKAVSEAVSEPHGGREHRYPCGLTADEIVAIFINEFDAVEVPVE